MNNKNIIIAGNWKMNITPKQTKTIFGKLISLIKNTEKQVIVCVPFVDIEEAIRSVKNTNIKIGAQNCHFELNGAYTGEISADMLKEMGVEYTIVGHSERRKYFAENDRDINKKILILIGLDITPILCVGETLSQRQKNKTEEIIRKQLMLALKSVPKNKAQKIIIAYEPIWAIGTGKTATSIEAENICIFIRNTIQQLFGKEISENIHILYGGSMNEKNAKELLKQPNINGGLIGGASLDPIKFSKIIN